MSTADDADNDKLIDTQNVPMTRDKIRLVFAFVIFLLWMLFVITPIQFAIKPEGSQHVLMLLTLMAFGVGCSYWLLYSKNGPGLDGLAAGCKHLLKPIIEMPENKRMFAVAPIFGASVFALLFSIAWLCVSDEASQKRTLYGTYERGSSIQWFHHGMKVDIYVSSESLAKIYKERAEQHLDDTFVGAKLTYSGQLMGLTGSKFQDMIHNDLVKARSGNILDVTGHAEIGLYKKKITTFDSVNFHGAFGLTGFGTIEIIIMMSSIGLSISSALSSKSKSITLFGWSLVLLFLASTPWAMGSLETPEPEMVQIFHQGH